MPDDVRWSWCNNRNKVYKKCNAFESCPNPNPQSMEKTVLHQTAPWCQKVWGPLIKTLTTHDSFNPHDLCDGSFRHNSQESPHPDIHTLYNPLPWVWAGQGDLTPVVENTQKWCYVTSEVRLQTTRAPVWLALFFLLSSHLVSLMNQAGMLWAAYTEIHVARDQGKFLANSPETCNSDPTTLKELNPDSTLLSESGGWLPLALK